MVQVAVSNPTVPNRVTQVVPLAELCSLILATWVIVYCVHMLMVRSQEGPYCNTIIVTSSKTVPLLCLCLEWGKRVYIRSGLKKTTVSYLAISDQIYQIYQIRFERKKCFLLGNFQDGDAKVENQSDH